MDILAAKLAHWLMFALAIWKVNLIKGHMVLLELITKR